MTQPKICPKCGTPQQWEMWRHCACGYDFGPGEKSVEADVRPPTSNEEPEEEWPTEEQVKRLKQFCRRVCIGILLAFLLTHFIYPMEWLTNAAAGVFLFIVLVGDPAWLWKKP